MPITVVVRSGAHEGSESPAITLDAPMIVLGRGESCDVRLPDPSVSHRHATIRQRGSDYILQDEGSTNGTFIGGVRLGVQAPRILRHGEVVRLGRIFLEVKMDALVPTSQPTQATKEIALGLVAQALVSQGEAAGPRLDVVEGPDAGKRFWLDEVGRAYVVGRGRDVDFTLDDAESSRRHLQIVRRGEVLLVRDLGSRNGAVLEPDVILPLERDVVVRVGDRLRLAETVLVYEHPAVQALMELEAAPDEKLNESLAPPPPPSSVASEEPVAPSGPPPPQEPRAVEIAVSSESEARSGWTGADVIVVLLAIGVLALSGLGLYWLLQG